jgi:alpha-tubulin suppressor-like RCC1 family protein
MSTRSVLAAVWFLALVCAGVAAFAAARTGASSSHLALSAGAERFSCALDAGGGVQCWGSNTYGQLGDGSTAQSGAPVDVVGLGAGVTSLDTGDQHACAVTASGGVVCWGRNDRGQLGNGSTIDSSTPVSVSGLSSGVVSVTAGNRYSCAVTSGGGAQCWGGNSFGRLGDGTLVDSSVPVQVAGLTSGVASVTAGNNSTCALMTSGGVKCWGSNADGQLGNGTTTGSSTPVDVSGLTSGVSSISAGLDYTCAVTAAGAAKCWGTNTTGQLGNGGTLPSAVPAGVVGLSSGVANVSTGRYHTCATLVNGGAMCWGDNDAGQLGDGGTNDSLVPVAFAKPTPTPTPSPTATPLPPQDPDADTDSDATPNSTDADDDNDGCPDANETQLGAGSETSGGRRNPHDTNDYFNPSLDGQNRVDDILLVVNQYFIDSGNPGYNADMDRTLLGPLAWNLGPPNGLQRVDDILNQVKQYFHDCG